MADYFKYYPKIKYNNKKAIDITRRVNILESVNSKPYAYLPYTIDYGMSPDQVAYYYYNDVGLWWLVLMSNDIIDPHKEWPLWDEAFDNAFIEKYRSQAASDGYTDVLRWGKNESITTNIIHYVNKDDTDYVISKDSYTLNPEIVGGDWNAKRAYDYELEVNEDKREIFLLNREYATIAKKNLRNLIVSRR